MHCTNNDDLSSALQFSCLIVDGAGNPLHSDLSGE